MGTREPEDIRISHEAAMGAELGALYYKIYNELIYLHLKWHEYKSLFGTNESRIDLLNECAPTLFFIIDRLFWDDVLLTITKITDPEISAGHKNMTIDRFPNLLNDEGLKLVVKKLINEIKGLAQFCRDARDKRIAHFDYDLHIKEPTHILDNGSRERIDSIIKKLSSVMNEIHVFYLKSEIGFQYIVSLNGAEDMLYLIRDGLKLRREKERTL